MPTRPNDQGSVSDTLMAFGQQLRQLRKQAGLTLEDLAKWMRIAGASRTQISDIELGKVEKPPSWQFVRRYVETCDEHGQKPVSASTELEFWRAQLHLLDQAQDKARVRRGQPAGTANNSLPPPPRDFTGREDELASLLSAAARPGAGIAIHSIDGMPGIGKTALALYAASRLAKQYPDGQLYVNLNAHSADPDDPPVNPSDALEALLVGAGATRIPESLPARSAAWRSQVRDRRVLVVLDNAKGSAQVTPLLPGSPTCFVIVTSRRRMAGLEDVEPISLDTLDADEAIELFVRSVGSERAGTDRSLIADIVHRCGHLPLAIRLVAGRMRRLKAMTVASLADELADTQETLGRLAAGDESVEAALAVSYAGLTVQSQRVMCLLGLHPGRQITAYATGVLVGVDPSTAAGLLEVLHDHNLLQEQAAGRYRMHDLVDEFTRKLARDHVGAEDRENRLTTAMAAYLRTAESAPDAAWLGQEWPNLVAYGHVAVERRALPEAVALSRLVHGYLSSQGYIHEARRLEEAVLRVAEELGERACAAASSYRIGVLDDMRGRVDEARRSFEAALDLYIQLNDRQGQGAARRQLGKFWSRHDGLYFREGETYFLRAIQDSIAAGDLSGEATSLAEFGRALAYGGPVGRAEMHLRQALDVGSDGGIEGRAMALLGMSEVELRVAAERSVPLAREALSLMREVGNRAEQASALEVLAGAARRRDRPDQAIDYLSEALAIMRELDDNRRMATILTSLGDAFRAAHRDSEAEDAFTRAITVAAQAGDDLARVRAWRGLSELDLGAGRTESAKQKLREGLAVFGSGGTESGEPLKDLPFVDDLDCRAEIGWIVNTLRGLTGTPPERGGPAHW